MYRTVPGLEHVKIVRNAYAIEYDCINASTAESLHLNLRKSAVYLAEGSLMEVQAMKKRRHRGLIAGINAARKMSGQRTDYP